MPHFKSTTFIKRSLKLDHFCKKIKMFERLGLQPQTPETAYFHCRFLATCLSLIMFALDQRWSRRHKARGQGQSLGHKKHPRPRPRTAFPRTDTLEAKDRNARGRGQGPRTQAQVLSKKKKVFTKVFQAISKEKKKVFTKIFQAISTKKRFPNNFSSSPQNFNNSKNSAVHEPRTGQFSRTWGLEAKAKDLTFEAKAKDFKMCPRGRPRSQGRPRGLHLCPWLQAK